MPGAREVIALALPALGALAAEPLYVLGDTAIVGHLGRVPLAGLAIAGVLLSEVVGLCTFLEYGTTAKAARLYGAGSHDEALDVGVQATWLAVVLGSVVAVVLELAAGPALRLIAGSHDGASLDAALTWFRIAAVGAPCMLVIAAAQGWLRAFQDTRTGLVVLVASNLASVALSLTLIRGFGLGIEGSAIANVASQVAAAARLRRAARAPRARASRPSWQRMLPQLRAARDLGLRSFAFTAAFLLAASVAARMGDAQVAAHQIGFQLWIFVALVLDSVAIAAQALIGRLLGAGAVDAAATLARRLLVAGLVFGIAVGALFAAGSHVVPALFSSDADVRHQAGRAVAVARRDDAGGRRAVRARRRLLRRRRPRVPAPHDADRGLRRVPADPRARAGPRPRPGRRVGRDRRLRRRPHAARGLPLALAEMARGGHADGGRASRSRRARNLSEGFLALAAASASCDLRRTPGVPMMPRLALST